MTGNVLVATALSVVLLWTGSARAQAVAHRSADEPQRQLVLTKDSEGGFRAFMDMVRGGKLGPDTREVNVDVSGGSVRLELLRESGPSMVFLLAQPDSTTKFSRYFDVQALENASASDCARVGSLLDEAFASSPFEEIPPPTQSAPGDALGAGNALQRAWRAFRARLMRPASLQYTIAVIILTGVALLASIVVLCMPPPTLDKKKSAPAE
jgi:hypothetical protein